MTTTMAMVVAANPAALQQQNCPVIANGCPRMFPDTSSDTFAHIRAKLLERVEVENANTIGTAPGAHLKRILPQPRMQKWR